MQQNNREAIKESFAPYCNALSFDDIAKDSDDFLYAFNDDGDCEYLLWFYHSRPAPSTLPDILYRAANKHKIKKANKELYTKVDIEVAISLLEQHYNKAATLVPASLDAKLMHDPLSLNPIRMMTSSLSHFDWWHVIGNIIFFFAFSVALEYVINSSWRFMLSLVSVSLTTGIFYSLAIYGGAPALPTQGLSGVVAGVMGMSAYLLPNVRIRVFVWVFTFARNLYVPAIYLAMMYIGWDTYYLISDPWSSSVNLVAHVSGGFAGYFIARYFFKELREETKDEVDDEVEYMGALRQDKLGTMSSYRSNGNHITNVMEMDRAKRDFASWLDKIYTAINADQDSVAINIALSRYDDYRHSIDLYDNLYHEMLKWKKTRAILCISRLLISEYIDARKYAKAINVAQKAYEICREFIFANEEQRELLEAIARRQNIKLSHHQ